MEIKKNETTHSLSVGILYLHHLFLGVVLLPRTVFPGKPVPQRNRFSFRWKRETTGGAVSTKRMNWRGFTGHVMGGDLGVSAVKMRWDVEEVPINIHIYIYIYIHICKAMSKYIYMKRSIYIYRYIYGYLLVRKKNDADAQSWRMILGRCGE